VIFEAHSSRRKCRDQDPKWATPCSGPHFKPTSGQVNLGSSLVLSQYIGTFFIPQRVKVMIILGLTCRLPYPGASTLNSMVLEMMVGFPWAVMEWTTSVLCLMILLNLWRDILQRTSSYVPLVEAYYVWKPLCNYRCTFETHASALHFSMHRWLAVNLIPLIQFYNGYKLGTIWRVLFEIQNAPPALFIWFLREHCSEWPDHDIDANAATTFRSTTNGRVSRGGMSHV
jgi:hypothetical protein